MTIRTIETPQLGDRSYLVHDGHLGVVIDPQRDLHRVLAEIADADADVTVTHVFETHLHNDYVSGGLALAASLGAHYAVAAGDDVTFTHTPIHDGDVIVTGQLRVRAIPPLATPFTICPISSKAATRRRRCSVAATCSMAA